MALAAYPEDLLGVLVDARSGGLRGVRRRSPGRPAPPGSRSTAAYDENSLNDDYPTVFGAAMDIGLRYDDRDLLARLAQVVDDAGALAPRVCAATGRCWVP